MRLLATSALAFAALVAPASAYEPRTQLELRFGSELPAHSTSAMLRIVYSNADDPAGKPPPVKKIVVEPPAGTRIDNAAVPVCRATDDEFRSMGRDACPAASRVGEGGVTVMTGFAPLDPFETEVTIFNGGDQIIELAQVPGTNATLAVERVRLSGATLTAEPAPIPGGGSLREVLLHFHGDRGFIVTPTDCPPGGEWISRADVTYRDGVETTAQAATPCQGDEPTRKPRLQLHGVPPRCASEAFRLRVAVGGGVRVRWAAVRLDGRRIRRARRARFTVRVPVRRLAPGRHSLTVLVATDGGERVRARRRFARCR